VIKAAPYSFFVCVGILVFIGWGAIWFIFRYRIEKYQESVAHLERDAKRLEKELERSPVSAQVAVSVPSLGTAKLPPVMVDFAPWEGQSDRMYLTVTNRGHEQLFEAQCRVIERRNDPNPTPLRTFDLQWESGTRALHLRSGQSGNLHIASVGKGPATNTEWMRLEAAPVGQHGQQGPESRWTTPAKSLPEYDVGITIIGQQSNQQQSEVFTVRAGNSRALEMFKRGLAVATPETLAERTVKLRREIEDFVIGVGRKPKAELSANDSSLEIIKKSRQAVELWYNKITYGYERLYAEGVRQVFLEYGELGLLPMGFNSDIKQAQSVEDGIKQVIARLVTLEYSLRS
jgi:hypothetical protein